MDSGMQNGAAKPLSASGPAAAAVSSTAGGRDAPTQKASPLRDRWETAFVWSFIIRFTDLKGKIEGLENIDDFEESTHATGANPIILAILARFIENLYPKGNTKPQFISQTLFQVVSDKCGANERSVWWDIQLNRNVPPLSPDTDFFVLPSDLKVELLRQLVEWQLSHNESVRGILDNAYGVQRGAHKKKLEGSSTKDAKDKQKADVTASSKPAGKRPKRNSQTPPETNGEEDRTQPGSRPEEDPYSRRRMQMAPLGVDRNRKRYWAVDDSPRLYMSGNPWKWTCPFKTIASTRDEYMAVIDRLKAEQSPMKPGVHRGKFDRSHDDLISLLEGERLTHIDSELFRLSKVKQRIRERQLQRQKQAEKLKSLAELRMTRTRVKTKKVDYVYDLGSDDEHGIRDLARRSGHAEDGEYLDENNIEEDGDEEEFGDEQEASGSRQSLRRSGRITSTALPTYENGRSSRRNTRSSISQGGLGKEQEDDQEYQPRKRRRLSSAASDESRSFSVNQASSTQEKAQNGAAVIKPHEKVVEAIGGRKKSKFWYYAVEEAPGAPSTNGAGDLMSAESTNSGASTAAVEGVEGDLKALELHSAPSSTSQQGDGGTPEDSDMYVDG